MRKNSKIKEFGDFQTSERLASKIINHLKKLKIFPASIIEPTCGTGSFVLASLNVYPNAKIIGMDINLKYINILLEKLDQLGLKENIDIKQANFFEIDWKNTIRDLPKPVLIVGNPPWITSSEIGSLGGSNLPNKENFYGLNGLDALTGKSNFDISEWMIIQLLNSLTKHESTLAMLCKVSVARKIFRYCHREKISLASAKLYIIDSKKHFNASVDSCLFICNLLPESYNYICLVYNGIESKDLIQEIGYIEDKLIAEIPYYQKWKLLQGKSRFNWRSGIKHDCSKVMELLKEEEQYINGYKELVVIEEDYLYPMLKSSDLANNRIEKTNRWMLVTQKFIGEDTSSIKSKAPLTWKYLKKHAQLLDNRASSIYKNRPKFSIFGVGDYSFSKWKIAISGFYKKLNFSLITPLYDKPVVFDDTCYFISAESYEEAVVLYIMLNHSIAEEFYRSFIFWDAKRPITKEVLQRLDFRKLYIEIGRKDILDLIEKYKLNVNSQTLNTVLTRFSDPLNKYYNNKGISLKSKKNMKNLDDYFSS